MNERNTGAFSRVVKIATLLTAAALISWALADDYFIGGGPGFGGTQAGVLLVGLALAASCLLPLGWNARALALVLSTVFMLFAAEATLQVLFSARLKSENELDTRLLYRPVPGAIRSGNRDAINGGDRITYQINSQGFRGAELEAKPEFRIVVYGDSFIHGYYSNLPNTFAVRLSEHLSKKLGKDIEVVNAGVAGYGPDQELRKMQGELAGLKPDLVLVAIFTGNDFGDPMRNKLYRLDESGKLVDNPFTLEPSLEREMTLGRRESLVKRGIRDALYAIAVKLGLRPTPSNGVESMTPLDRMEYFRDRHIREYDEYVVKGDGTVYDQAWDCYDADVSLTPNSDSARYKVQLMDGIVGQMQQLCAGIPVPLVIIPIPHPVDVGGHPTGEVDHAKYPDYRPRGMVDIIEQISSRHGVPTVDLFTPFQSRGTADIYFHGFDDHWNDAGQDLAASVVADSLIEGGYLDKVGAGRPLSVDRSP